MKGIRGTSNNCQQQFNNSHAGHTKKTISMNSYKLYRLMLQLLINKKSLKILKLC